MGMDIYGLNPTIIGDKPEFPDNFRNLSNKAQDYYWELDKEWEDNNPGHYFRANIWSWRVINAICIAAIEKFNLDIDTHGWDSNSGFGSDDSAECNVLADALQEFVEAMEANDVKELGINMGMWTTKKDNGFQVEELEEKDLKILNILCDGIVDNLPVKYRTVAGKVVELYPSHSTDINHLKEFILFLRNCNGFKIL